MRLLRGRRRVHQILTDDFLLQERALHAPLRPLHLPEGLHVPVRHLELLPELPEGDLRARIAELRGVEIDGSRAVDLPEPRLQRREAQRDVLHAVVRDRLHGLLEDLARFGGAVVGLDLLDVEKEDLVGLSGRHGAGGAVEDVHAVPYHAVLLLHLRVEQVELLAGLRGNGFETLCDEEEGRDKDFLEDVAGSLDLGVLVAENESVEVLQPDLAAVRVGEGVEAFLEDAEGLFVAVVLFEIGGVVQNVLRREERGRKEYLRRDDVEIEHAIVGSARGVHRADALFHVQKQVPESVRLVDAFLDRLVAFSREGEYAWHATRESRQSLKESESESGIGWREREREDLGEVSRDK